MLARLRPRVLVAVTLALATANAAWAQAPLRKIGQLRLAVLGISASPDPAAPVVPKNTPSGVRIVVRGGAGDLAAADLTRFLGPDVEVRGELVGPTLTEPVALTSGATADPLLLPLPALSKAGDYQVSNLRLVAGGRPVLDVTPARLTVRVIEQVLITSVRTRPLTLQEIKDKGIVLDNDDYLGFEFTMGLALESKAVKITFPVVFDKDGTPLPEFTRPAANLPPLDINMPQLPEIVPTMLRLDPIGATPLGPLGGVAVEDIRIPSVLVIPGNVGYLKQFFSAQLFVANGTPVGANLRVRDLAGTIRLPAGDDHQTGTSDDPLALPDTAGGQAPDVLPIRTLGSDGEAGTPDDGGTLEAEEQAQAEFLIRGEREGFHSISFDIEGVLEGLPVGPVRVTGAAKGGVLVRNPYFDITFTVPSIVRRSEPFTLYATVTNKGQGLANAVTLSLDASRMSGAHLASGDTGTRQIDTLKSGDAATLTFRFESERTGQVVATYLKFDTADGSTGHLKFTLGVGERGVALSPDTLVLPSAVDVLPVPVVEAAMRVLGQAWSIANAPPNSLPASVVRVSQKVATEKALALAEAGLRVTLGQPVDGAVRDIAIDFWGGTPIDRGLDQLLRETEAGRNLARAIGAELADTVGIFGGALGYERELARLVASGPDVVTLAIAPAGSVDVMLTDAAGRRTTTAETDAQGAPIVPEHGVASAVFLPLGAGPASPILGLVTAPTASPYSIDLTAAALASADLSITLPRGDGTFVRGRILGAALPPSARARVVVDLARPDALAFEIDGNGDGAFETSQPLILEAIAPEGPRLLSATVIGPETIATAGPFGLHVALLFDRIVDAASAADRARYQIPSNAFRIAKRQLSGRLVFGQLEQPEGPYVPTAVGITGLADGRGVVGPAATVPLQSRLRDPGAVVTGRVFHADGVVIEHGVIRYLNNVDWTCQSPLPDLALAVRPLGADGRFEFRYVRQDPCGLPFRLYTTDPVTYAVRTLDTRVRAAGERLVLDIALFGTGSVSGVVRDVSGLPVGGALVRVQSATDAQVQGAAMTDGDGRYTITAITVGPVSVTAQKALNLGSAAGRILRAGTTAAVDVTLDTGTAALSGVVRRLDSGVTQPVGGALVQYYLVQQTGIPPRLVRAVLTGADGTFALDPVPAGAYFLQATYAGRTYERTSTSGSIALGQRIDNLELLIEAHLTATVRGVVQLANLTPVAEALVAFGDGGALTDASGRYELPYVPVRDDRPQTLEAFSSDRLRRGQTSVFVTTPGFVEAPTITLSALGSAEVTVYQGGVPVADQEVVILADPSMLRGMCSMGCGCALATARTNASGVALFENLPVGRAKARATRIAAGFVDVAETEFSITADGATGYGVLRLAGAGTITGTVIGPDGNLAFGADITIRSRAYNPAICTLAPAESHRIRTDLNGRFRVTTVAVGAVSVTASHIFAGNQGTAGAQVVLTEAGQTVNVNLTIPSTTAGELSGVVYLPDGVTPAGAGVEMTANGPLPDVTVRTDDQGRFRFAKIFPAGTYRLTARDPATGGLAQDLIALKTGQDFAHDVRLKGRGTVRVKVVTALGDPVTSVFVRLAETDFPRRTYEGVADASNLGVVTFENIFEGPLAVEVSDVYARGGRASGVLPAPGATVDLTVSLTVTGSVAGCFTMPASGDRIPFATVRLVAASRVVGQTTTGGSGDELGCYRFTYVPAGALRVEAQDPLTARTGFAVGDLKTEGQVVTIDVVAQSLGSVEGLVTGGGAPLAGARVDLRSGVFHVTTQTSADGRYRVDGVPAGQVSVVASTSGGLFSGTASATLAGEGAVVTLDVAVRDAGRITGRIVAAGGSPPPPTVITVAVGGIAATMSAATDETGAFVFERVPAGVATLTADVVGSIDRGREVVTVPGSDTVDVTIALNGVGRIAGLACNAAGQPVSGDLTITGTGAFSYSFTLTVPAEGTFVVPTVLAGSFTARLSSRVGGFTLYGTTSGEVAPGDTATQVEVRLQESGSVTGVVMRAGGTTPAVGAEIRVGLGGGREVIEQAGSDGRFTAIGVPLGAITLRLSDPFTGGLGFVTGLSLAADGETVDAGLIVLDDSPVTVAAIEPSGVTNTVGVKTPITITFSDPIASTYGIQVKRGTTVVGSLPSLSADARVVTLAPSSANGWPDSADLTVTISTDVADVYGRRLALPVTSAFRTVDLTPPVVVSIVPANASVQVEPGASITVTFSEPLGPTTSLDSLVVVTGPAGPVAGTAAFASPAAVTFTPAAPLSADAIYSVIVMGAVDETGNVQTVVFAASFATLDTVPPVLALHAPSATGWTRSARPAISIDLSDATSGIDAATGTLALDGVAMTPNRSVASISYVPPSDLAQGEHILTATVADRAGHVGSLAAAFRIDSVPPDPATITGVAADQVVSGTVTIGATAVDATSGVSRIDLYRDGVLVVTLPAPAFETAVDTRVLPEGAANLTGRAIDVAENVAAIGPAVRVIVDNKPLVVTITAPAVNAAVRDAVTVKASVNETVDRIGFGVGCSAGLQACLVTATDTTSPYEATLDLTTVGEAVQVVTVTAVGLLGETASATRTIVVDRTPPALPDASRMSAEPPVSGQSLVVGRSGSVEAGASLSIANTASGATAASTAAADGSFSASIAAAIDDVLQVRAADALGNTSAPTLVVVRRTPSLPPAEGSTSLTFDGVVADRVGPGAAALAPDGQLDAVFSLTLAIGEGVTRQLSFIDLAGPVARSTRAAVGSVLGVAADAGSPLLNGPNGEVGFAVTGGATLTLFAADVGFIREGATYTATAGFTDGSRFVGTFTIVPAADRTFIAHSARVRALPPTVEVPAGGQGIATITIDDIRDIDGTRVPDGEKIALAAADMAAKDPRGGSIRSAGGAILDGVVAPNNAAFRVFTIAGGAVVATFSSDTVTPTATTGAVSVVQVLGADTDGNVLGQEAVATLDLNLRQAADQAIVEPAFGSLYADRSDRRVSVSVRVRDAAGTPLPDGTKVVATASGSVGLANGQYIQSAGGTIVGGATSPSGPSYRAFTIAGGRVSFEYSAQNLLAPVGGTTTAVIQIYPADANGYRTFSSALGTGTIALTGSSGAEMRAVPESVPVVHPSPLVQIVVQHVHDTRSNLVPDGARFLVTANANVLITGGAYVQSAGGAILDGETSPTAGYFKAFALAQGAFAATYAPQNVTALPGETKIARVQLAMADAANTRLSSEAVAVRAVTLVAPTHAVGAANPPAMLADGHLHSSTVTFAPVLDAYGNVLPDGSKVVVSAANNAATRGGQYISSAGGQILNGDTSPSGANYRALTVQDGAVVVQYGDQNVTATPGQIKEANVVLLEATAAGAVQSAVALGVVPVSLAGLTSATATANPATLHADGADRRAVVTIANVRDAAGHAVPDGTKVAVSAASCATMTGGGCTPSAGGTILGSEPGAVSTQRIFTLQNGQAIVDYSAQGLTVATGEQTATVQVISIGPTGSALSLTAVATVPIRLLAPSTAAVAVAPVDLFADGGDRLAQVVVGGITDTGGVPAPDGAKVALTAANYVAIAPDNSAYITSAGGRIDSAGTSPGDGTPATNNGNFKIFTVAGGEVRAAYSAQGLAAGVNETKVARLAVVHASDAGATLTTRAFAVGTVNLRGTSEATASGPATATVAGAPVTITFSGIKDSAGNTVPDGALVAITAAGNALLDPSTGQWIPSVGGSIADGTPAGDTRFRVFVVTGGSVTVTYQPSAAGTARISIAPARPDGTLIGSKALVGGTWTITVQ